jgi:hypothetical protein
MKGARSEAKANRVLVSALTDGGVPTVARAVTLSVTDEARRLARALTWFTLGMEALLTLLVPLSASPAPACWCRRRAWRPRA